MVPGVTAPVCLFGLFVCLKHDLLRLLSVSKNQITLRGPALLVRNHSLPRNFI